MQRYDFDLKLANIFYINKKNAYFSTNQEIGVVFYSNGLKSVLQLIQIHQERIFQITFNRL
jgi:hypothetical protein